MSRLISIGVAVPEYVSDQNDILDFMTEEYNNEFSSRKLRTLFHFSKIDTRYSVLPDFTGNSGNKKFFNQKNKPDVERRMQIYQNNAAGLSIKAITNSFSKIKTDILSFGITHLIVVTCTGIYSPGIDTEIMKKLKLPSDIFHTGINFLGCNAAFPALRIGDSICRTDKDAHVLIVCVELCTIHFQPKNNDDNLLSNTIFSDGAAAALMVSDDYACNNQMEGLALEGFYSRLLDEGNHLMGWNITPFNFEMILNPRIPDFISHQISSYILAFTKRFNMSPADINKWAVHPGGRKILDELKNKLDLTTEDLQYSYRILREYGNMSSATILFVLNLITNADPEQGERIFALGFGPGINIDSLLMTYEK